MDIVITKPIVDALELLKNNEQFVIIGDGKTTALQYIKEQIQTNDNVVVYIDTNNLSKIESLISIQSYICAELIPQWISFNKSAVYTTKLLDYFSNSKNRQAFDALYNSKYKLIYGKLKSDDVYKQLKSNNLQIEYATTINLVATYERIENIVFTEELFKVWFNSIKSNNIAILQDNTDDDIASFFIDCCKDTNIKYLPTIGESHLSCKKIEVEITEEIKQKKLFNLFEGARKGVCQQSVKLFDHTDEQGFDFYLPISPFCAFIVNHIRELYEDFKITFEDIVNSEQFDKNKVFTIDMLFDLIYKSDDMQKEELYTNYKRFEHVLDENGRKLVKAISLINYVYEKTESELFICDKPVLLLAYEDAEFDLDEAIKNGTTFRVIKDDTFDGKFYIENDLTERKQAVKSVKNSYKNFNLDYIIEDGELATCLNLPQSLNIRLEGYKGYKGVFISDYRSLRREVNRINDLVNGDKEFYNQTALMLVLSLKQEDVEVTKQKVKEVAEENKHIIFVDASEGFLPENLYDKLIDESVAFNVYNTRDSNKALAHRNNYEGILKNDFQEIIRNCNFNVYYNGKHTECSRVFRLHNELSNILKDKFSYTIEFNPNIPPKLLKLNTFKMGIRNGIDLNIDPIIVKQLFKNETIDVKSKFWELYPDNEFSKIKLDFNEYLNKRLTDEVDIEILDIWYYLANKYGFTPCGIYGVIFGLLMSEFVNREDIFFMDLHNIRCHLNELKFETRLEAYIFRDQEKRSNRGIVGRICVNTEYEDAFYKAVNFVFNANCKNIVEVYHYYDYIGLQKIFPWFVLKYITDEDTFHVISMIMKGMNEFEHNQVVAWNEVGKLYLKDIAPFRRAKIAFSKKNFREGAIRYLKEIHNGEFWELIDSLKAEDQLLEYFYNIYSHSNYMIRCFESETFNELVENVYLEYKIVKIINEILGTYFNDIERCFSFFSTALADVKVSILKIAGRYSTLAQHYNIIYGVFCSKQNNCFVVGLDMVRKLLDIFEECKEELKDLLNNRFSVDFYREIYSPLLNDFTDNQIKDFMYMLSLDTINLEYIKASENYIGVKDNNSASVFTDLSVEHVTKCIEEVKKLHQSDAPILIYWKEATGTLNPQEWCNKHKMCIKWMNLYHTDEEKISKFITMFENVDKYSYKEQEDILKYVKNVRFAETLIGEDEANIKNHLCRVIYGRENSSSLEPQLEEFVKRFLAIESNPYYWYNNHKIYEVIQAKPKSDHVSRFMATIKMELDEMTDEQIRELVYRHITNPAIVTMLMGEEDGKENN